MNAGAMMQTYTEQLRIAPEDFRQNLPGFILFETKRVQRVEETADELGNGDPPPLMLWGEE